MNIADKAGLAGLLAILTFIMFTVRLHERLACTATADGAGLDCERVLTKLIISSDEHFHVPDAGTVTLRVSSHTTSSHNSVNTSRIKARDERGRDVILLSVPEDNVTYAEDLATALRHIGRSPQRSVSFDRDETGHLWLLVLFVAGFAAAYIVLSQYRYRARGLAKS
jgi:hypothetical protein